MVSVSHASSDQVEHIIELLEPLLMEEDPAHCVMAFLAMSIIIQKPKASREEVILGVQGASEWIALYLSEVDQMDRDGVDGNKVTLN